MKLEAVILLCIGIWAHSDAQCTTPLGSRSQCVSLYDCEPLHTAFQARPLQPNVITYLRRSSCGFQGKVPKVCCGPVPQDTTPTSPRPSQTNRPTASGGRPAASFSEDSAPSPRGQCGTDSNADRIIGGELTDLDEFPWMALLGYRTSRGGLTYQCGGALINRRYVLTAAHCVVGEIETKVGRLATVRLGEYDTNTEQDCLDGTCAEPAQEYDVSRAVANPGFRDGQANRQDDIAIVRMAQRAKLNFYVRPICLPDGNSPRLNVGSEMYVAGWGKTLDGKPSNIKLKLSLPIFSKAECSQKYARLGANLIDRQLCAGGGFAKDACRGDSGGPLMRFVSSPGYWEQVGVVSFGNGCGREDWPGIYTSVAHYRDWIVSTMRETNN